MYEDLEPATVWCHVLLYLLCKRSGILDDMVDLFVMALWAHLCFHFFFWKGVYAFISIKYVKWTCDQM